VKPFALGVRLAAATLAAVAGIVALHHTVRAHERRTEAAADAQRARRGAELPSPLLDLAFRLVPHRGTVLLARSPDGFAPAVAPVLEVLADGALAVRRTPPLGPSPPPDLEIAVGEVGVVVPGGAMATWTPRARATLAELLGSWIDVRPAPTARVRVVDAPIAERELAMLLAWVP
jgi:hypothetical protein